MGADKGLLPYRGVPMAQHIADQLRPHFEELLLSTNDGARYAFLRIKTVPDREPGQGPLMGIASALNVSGHERNFVVACDIPEVPLPLVWRLLEELGDADCAVPVTEGGGYEPLFAVYRKRLAPLIDELLANGERKAAALFACCAAREVPIEAGTLLNVNTKSEYDALTRGED